MVKTCAGWGAVTQLNNEDMYLRRALFISPDALPLCARCHSGGESTQQRVSSSSNHTPSCCHGSEDSYCGLLGNNYYFYPEDGCSTGLRNVTYRTTTSTLQIEAVLSSETQVTTYHTVSSAMKTEAGHSSEIFVTIYRTTIYTLMMGAVRSSKTSVTTYQTIIYEDGGSIILRKAGNYYIITSTLKTEAVHVCSSETLVTIYEIITATLKMDAVLCCETQVPTYQTNTSTLNMEAVDCTVS